MVSGSTTDGSSENKRRRRNGRSRDGLVLCRRSTTRSSAPSDGRGRCCAGPRPRWRGSPAGPKRRTSSTRSLRAFSEWLCCSTISPTSRRTQPAGRSTACSAPVAPRHAIPWIRSRRAARRGSGLRQGPYRTGMARPLRFARRRLRGCVFHSGGVVLGHAWRNRRRMPRPNRRGRTGQARQLPALTARFTRGCAPRRRVDSTPTARILPRPQKMRGIGVSREGW